MSVAFSIPSFAAEDEQTARRMPVCILPLQNATGHPDLNHWRETSQALLMSQLGDFKSLRIMPSSSVDYGIRQASVDIENAITPEQAMRIGRELQVSRVIWGRYNRRDQDWEITVRIGKVVDQTVSKELTARGRTWNSVIDSIESQLLAELEAKPGQLHRDKPSLCWATSPEALECYSQAHADRLSFAKAEEELQRAVTLDPKFVKAYIGLAATFGSEGKNDSARKTIEQAITLNADEAGSHLILGKVLVLMNDLDGAAVELRNAINLDPDQSEANNLLGRIHAFQGQLDQALSLCKAAKQANPFDSSIIAGLAQVYAMKGDEASARAELNDAVRFAPTNNTDGNIIAACYELLHDPYSAVQYYKKFIVAGRKAGLNPDVVTQIEKNAQELEARLTPHYVTNTMPQSFTPQELAKILQTKLTSEELAQVTNPLESTPEMRAWAEKLTRGLTNDFDKAQALFRGVMQQFRFGDVPGLLTAREVFSMMDDKTATFNCWEGANLYVALGRDVGLKTYLADVHQDFRGEHVSHCCAALFIKTNALLVDASYRWFGVPHKQVTILDDLQAVGESYYFMAQDLPGKSGLPRFQIAEEIYPDFEACIFQHMMILFQLGQWEEARKLIPAAIKANREGWRLDEEEAMLADHDGQNDVSLSLAAKASQLNPDDGTLHFNLAVVLLKNGRLAEARDEYQAALRHDLRSEERAEALQKIVAINERLPLNFLTAVASTNAPPPTNSTTISPTNELNALLQAAAAGDTKAELDLGAAYGNGGPGLARNEKEAFQWYRKAAESGDSNGEVMVGWCYDRACPRWQNTGVA